MVRRNPYEMKKQKTGEQGEEDILKARKEKRREKPMLTRCPGLFFFCSKQSI